MHSIATLAVLTLMIASRVCAADQRQIEEARELLNSGQAVFQKGDYALARERWVKAVALDPDNVAAQESLRKVRRMLGDVTPTKQEIELFKTMDERAIGSHAISFTLAPVSAGISSGTLMAYGHIVRPPFEIRRVEHQLFVNGVRVLPSLLAERKRKTNPWEPPEPSPEERAKRVRFKQLHQQCETIYKESWFGARRKILALLSKHPDLVSDVEVAEDGAAVSFKRWDIKFRYGWEFASKFRMQTPAVIAENERSAVEMQRALMERDLRAGLFVVVTSNDQIGPMNDPRNDVNSIMNNPSLSRDERILELTKIFGYGTALDVLENYSKEEWSTAN